MVHIPEELQEVLGADPEMMSGAVCFKGTRVLVQSLLDTLYNGGTVEDFLDGFPDISEEQAMAVVRWEQFEARRAFGIPVPA
jgi:uncharacterized protein (DUF433 family)